MKIGYAPKAESSRHRHLPHGQACDVLSHDLSYNEVITAIERVEIPGGGEIAASTLSDMIAERCGAMIQQPIRNQTRRQVLHDIFRLLERPKSLHGSMRTQLLTAPRKKTESRGITVKQTSLRDPAIAERCKAEYDRVQQEILSELPEFDYAYPSGMRFL